MSEEAKFNIEMLKAKKKNLKEGTEAYTKVVELINIYRQALDWLKRREYFSSFFAFFLKECYLRIKDGILMKKWYKSQDADIIVVQTENNTYTIAKHVGKRLGKFREPAEDWSLLFQTEDENEVEKYLTKNKYILSSYEQEAYLYLKNLNESLGIGLKNKSRNELEEIKEKVIKTIGTFSKDTDKKIKLQLSELIINREYISKLIIKKALKKD